MPENALADVGFADFVAVLLVETLDSIVASHTSQEERLRALDGAAGLTVEEFASTGITVEMVDAAVARLFPDREGGTTLVEGGPVPDGEALAELEVALGRDDVTDGELTAAGVSAVRDGVALHLARRQLEAVREVSRRGVPRVLVDGGTLRARVNFTAVRADAEPEPDPDPAPRPVPVLGDVAALRPAMLSLVSPLNRGVLDSIRTTRLRVVQPAEDGEPSTTATVTGEVEIRFRTEL